MKNNFKEMIELHTKAHGFPPTPQFICWWRDTTNEYREYFTRLMNQSVEQNNK